MGRGIFKVKKGFILELELVICFPVIHQTGKDLRSYFVLRELSLPIYSGLVQHSFFINCRQFVDILFDACKQVTCGEEKSVQ